MPAACLGPLEGWHIAGAGTAFPRRQWTNMDVLRGLPAAAWGRRPPDSDEQFQFLADSLEATQGVRVRHWAHIPWQPLQPATEETTVDLAVAAGRAALLEARVDIRDLAFIITSTSTPHRMTSTTSAAVGAALGSGCPCMDVRTGCAGGLFALATAAMLVVNLKQPVLLLGTETFSKIIPVHKVAATSLGDGAGALLLVPGRGALLSAWLQTDGTLGRIISTDGALPPTAEEMARGGYVLSGAPEELGALVPGKYVEAIGGALQGAGISLDEVMLHVPHQSGKPVMDEVARVLPFPLARTHVTLPQHANIGVAGWMVALADARAQGRIQQGQTVLFSAVGGGMSWAAALYRPG